MPFRLYNSLTRQIEPVRLLDPAHATFYTCGPTVYDDAHVGNFRAFLTADLLRRWLESPLCVVLDDKGLEHAGPRRVTHVMNITDVGHMTDDAEGGERGEDRMAVAGRRLAEAKKSGRLPPGVAETLDPRDPYAIARFYENRFREDAVRLGLRAAVEAQQDPTLMPRATATVPGMILMITRLIERGHAYAVGPAGAQTVYFDVQSFPAYGRLSGNTLEHLRAGAGGRVTDAGQSLKRHPADFLLWKADPAHLMKWDSPWGAGYPGWHIECSVMAARRLAPARDLPGGTPPPDAALDALFARLLAEDARGAAPLIDLHSGGEDNLFPHHECEIAQSCCALARDPSAALFARHWLHVRFLMVEGEKMSKSKGNFFTARDLFEKGIEPAAVRLELIRTHYRSNANLSEQGLRDAQRTVERWRRVADAAAPAGAHDGPAAASEVEREFADALSDDLNIAEAIGRLNRWLARLDSPDPAAASLLKRIDRVLGVISLERPASASAGIAVFAGGLAPDPAVVALLEARREARARRDFAESDRLRDQIFAMGLAIKDLPGGRVEVSRG